MPGMDLEGLVGAGLAVARLFLAVRPSFPSGMEMFTLCYYRLEVRDYL